MSNAVSYKDLGLVNSRELFRKAVDGGFAIPAYNFNNLEQLQAIVTACVETRSPVIIQVSKGARNYANETMLRFMAMGAVAMAKDMILSLLKQLQENLKTIVSTAAMSGESILRVIATPFLSVREK